MKKYIYQIFEQIKKPLIPKEVAVLQKCNEKNNELYIITNKKSLMLKT